MYTPQENPIFVVGHSRSGSTLLASLLDNHPLIAALPETHFFLGLDRLSARQNTLVSKDVAQYISELYQSNPRLLDLPISKTELTQAALQGKLSTPKQVLDLLLTINKDIRGKQRVLEKSPLHIEHVGKILEWYPNARIICIIRDGRDAVDSLLAVPWTHSNKERHAAYWAWCVRQAKKYRELHPSEFMLIRYEDLLMEPTSVLTKLCAFIDVSYNPLMLATQRSDEIVPKWETGWKQKSKAELDPSYAYKWKQAEDISKAAYLQWFMKDELKYMQYDLIEKKTDVPLIKACIWNANFYTLLHIAMFTIRKYIIPMRRTFRHRQLEKSN
jgi:LPS sulfotransferase NodH